MREPDRRLRSAFLRRALACSLLLFTACFARSKPVARLMTKLTGGQTGWYRVEAKLGLSDTGKVELPPPTKDDLDAQRTDVERTLTVFQSQFTSTWIDSETPCLGIVGAEQPAPGPLYVLVHGVSGIGTEWVPVLPTLMKTRPTGLFMYRWFFATERGVILDSLVKGVNRLAQCYPNNPLVLLGHSAGGVLLAFAASRFDLGRPPHRADLLTVASPLAGVGMRPAADSDDDDIRFLNDLGSARGEYPAAAPGVFVHHLRTQYPADHVMKPNDQGYSPNAISAVVKGSKLTNVPVELGHDAALQWAAEQLAAGALP